MEERKWTTIIRRLMSEDTWDSEVFEATKSYHDNTRVFNVSEGTRAQVAYWKDRRNDCAHNKTTTITAQHVEIFWSFLRDHIHKFHVDGSRHDLVDRIVDHFDPDRTRPGLPPAHLTLDVQTTIAPTDLPFFLAEVVSALEGRDASPFWLDCLRSGSTTLADACRRVLAVNPETWLAALRADPSAVALFSGMGAEERILWRSLLKLDHPPDVSILVHMIRLGMIDKNELIDNAVSFVDSRSMGGCLPDEVPVLENAGIVEALLTLAFGSKLRDFDWLNNRAHAIATFISHRKLDFAHAERIARTFSEAHYPYTLATALKSVFSEKTELRQRLIGLIERNEWPWPKPILGPQPSKRSTPKFDKRQLVDDDVAEDATTDDDDF